MLRRASKPGDPVPPEHRLWWVNHYQHRVTHLASIQSAVFPRCAQCGDMVRFEPAPLDAHAQATPLTADPDFRPLGERPPAP